MTERLEQSAIRTAQSAPKGAARGSSIDFCWASTPEEYRALAKRVLVLVSVVTQDAAETAVAPCLCDRRRQGNGIGQVEQPAQRRAQGVENVLGAPAPSRGDGFYLAPQRPASWWREGCLQADFAVRRNGFNLYRLPGTPPDFIKAEGNPTPAPDAKPDTPALEAMLQREYRGFRIAGEPALAVQPGSSLLCMGLFSRFCVQAPGGNGDAADYSLYAVRKPPQCRPLTRTGTSISRIITILPLPMSRA